jgi:hypothetical protein
MRVAAILLRFGPIMFGIGFLAPLIAALIDTLILAMPEGVPSIAIGLVIGVALGSLAMRRRSWI